MPKGRCERACGRSSWHGSSNGPNAATGLSRAVWRATTDVAGEAANPSHEARDLDEPVGDRITGHTDAARVGPGMGVERLQVAFGGAGAARFLRSRDLGERLAALQLLLKTALWHTCGCAIGPAPGRGGRWSAPIPGCARGL